MTHKNRNRISYFTSAIGMSILFFAIESIFSPPWILKYFAIKLVTAAVFFVIAYGAYKKPETIIKITDAVDLTSYEIKNANRKVFIGLVSDYRWHSKKKPEISFDDLKEQVNNSDQEKPDLMSTNLGPILQSISRYNNIHKLKAIILITTEQSQECALLLKDYLIKYENIIPKSIITGPDWSIPTVAHEKVIKQTKEVMEKAQRFAKSHYCGEESIITEVTGGTNTMTIGSVLACINPGFDIQYTAIEPLNEDGDVVIKSFVYKFEVSTPRDVDF